MKAGKSTREAFGIALAELGDKHKEIVVVDGDVHNSTRTELFAKKYPDRFFNLGIAESNMVGVAAGLASSGKQAWAASFAAFINGASKQQWQQARRRPDRATFNRLGI